MNENLNIANLSTGGMTYFWDFCEGDLSLMPVGNSLLQIPNVGDV